MCPKAERTALPHSSHELQAGPWCQEINATCPERPQEDKRLPKAVKPGRARANPGTWAPPASEYRLGRPP